MPIYRSAPDDDEAMRMAIEMTNQVNAVLKLQGELRARIARRQEAERVERQRQSAAVKIQAATRGRSFRGWPKPEVSNAVSYEDSSLQALSEESLFTVRNLDTGESTTVSVDTRTTAPSTSALTFGSLRRGSSAWEAVRNDSRGLLEKLASKSTFSFRSYQLCVWQERYVFAEDDALCYQQLALDRTPSGKCKRIPYNTMQFVGPFDETQFVIKCHKRSFTFLCPTTEGRTRWIKNVSMLAGCSASTEVCRHTSRDSPNRASKRAVPSVVPVPRRTADAEATPSKQHTPPIDLPPPPSASDRQLSTLTGVSDVPPPHMPPPQWQEESHECLHDEAAEGAVNGHGQVVAADENDETSADGSGAAMSSA